MNIKADFTLESDPYDFWISETIQSKNGKKYEVVVTGYSPTFKGLINSYIKKEMSESNTKTFTVLYADIEKDEKRVEELNELCKKYEEENESTKMESKNKRILRL